MIKKLFLYVTALVILGTIAAYVFIYNKPHRSVREAAPDFSLSVASLVDAYTKDETKANSLYAGKVLRVNGPLRDIVRNDSSVILLMGDPAAIPGISCYLMKDQVAKTQNLNAGQTVSVKGICNGMLIDIVLDNGILLTDEP